MAKHKRKGGVIALRVDHQLAVLAPTTGQITATILADTVVNRLWLISVTWVLAFRDNTPADGPLYVGVAHSDYTAAQILEWYNAQGNWDRSDKIAEEQARRKIRRIGIFPGGGTDEVLNNGNEFKTYLGMMLEEGDTLEMFIINEGGATRTTGGVVEFHGTAWARNA